MKDVKITPPKVHELINWALGPSNEVPETFLMHESKLKTTVSYLMEQLWMQPKALKFINKHTNNLFNSPGGKEGLILFRKVLLSQGITRGDLYTTRPSFNPDFIGTIEKEREYDEGNAKALAAMMFRREIPLSSIKKGPVTKASVKASSNPEVAKIVQQAINTKKELEVKELQSQITTDHYINEVLTQELIDREELILFDVSLLKKTNRVLFIFIDRNNHKKYYTVPFSAKIYISKQQGVINNDYIEDITPEKFNGYAIQDIKLYTRLKYMLNGSYRRLVNGDGL